MSFRELRNFTEIMRSLGYPRLVSMDNFRNPNFELVADCLHWLVLRYDPAVDLSDEISTEGDRVAFLKAATQIMLARATIKLNPKQLYAADGYAVKELLKIASVLYEATSKANAKEREDVDLNLNAKSFDVKVTRSLTSEITQRGAALYDALEKEPELREARQKSIMRNMDMDEIEKSVKQAISSVLENVESAERMLGNLERDEKNLEAKIERRKSELERSERRLQALQSVRPAYMDEYEKLQGDLQELYVVYLEKFRNLQWLESQLELHNRREQEKLDESDRALKRLQKRLREEELRILRGEQQVDESKVDLEGGDSDVDDDTRHGSLASRAGSLKGPARPPAPKRPSAANIRKAESSSASKGLGGTGGGRLGGGSMGLGSSLVGRVGTGSGSSSRGGGASGSVVGSIMGGVEEDDSGDDDDLLAGGATDGHDSESTHVSLEGSEESGDLIEDDDDDDDLTGDDDIDDEEEEGASDNEF